MSYRLLSRLDDVLGVAAIAVAVVSIVAFDVSVTFGEGFGHAGELAFAQGALGAPDAVRDAVALEPARPATVAAATHR